MKHYFKSFNRTIKIIKILSSISPILFILMPAIAVIAAGLPFVNYLFSLLIIDALSVNAGMWQLFEYAAVIIGLNVLMTFLIKYLATVRDVQTYKLELNFDKKIGEKVLELDYIDIESVDFHNIKRSIDQSKMRTGGITKVISLFEGITKNAVSMILAFISFLRIFSISVNTMVYSFWTGPWPLIILIAVLVLSVVWTSKMQIKTNQRITELNMRINEANGSAITFMQMISNYHFGKDIRIYNLSSLLSETINNMWNSSIGLKLLKDLARIKGLTPGISVAISAIISALAYLLAGMKAVNGEISIGTVILYAGSILVFTSAIIELIFSLGEILGCCDLLAPNLELLDIKKKMVCGNFPVENSKNLQHRIEFRKVSFRYPGNDEWSLRNVSFEILPGERIAVVGVNGSGKTTIIKLLCRLYDPTEGEILLDGKNIMSYNIEAYRELFGVVFQDFSLFSLSLGQNVASSQQVDEKKAYNALYLAGLGSWTEKMPKRLDTSLYQFYEDDGVEISGGESQKIAIARAIYKDTPFIVLDEPTAALDPLAEYEIYTNFDSIVGAKTVIYISHRLSSCRFCQRILVFHQGSIIQEGSHNQLLNHIGGKYYELWHAQAQFYV